MKTRLKDIHNIFVNSYNRIRGLLIEVYDDDDNVYSYTLCNIPGKVKEMKVERFLVASEKLLVINFCNPVVIV